MQADNWFLADGCFNSQDIESPWSIFQAARAEELASHAGQVTAFFKIDGVFGSGLAWLSFGSRFNFHERENSAVVGYEVEFTFDSRHSEISRDHDVAFTTQVPVGVGFSTYAGSARELFCGRIDGILREAFAGGKIQNRKHDLRKHRELRRLSHDNAGKDAAWN
jgi:hypothetical protein